jgi:hypothetical protein
MPKKKKKFFIYLFCFFFKDVAFSMTFSIINFIHTKMIFFFKKLVLKKKKKNSNLCFCFVEPKITKKKR